MKRKIILFLILILLLALSACTIKVPSIKSTPKVEDDDDFTRAANNMNDLLNFQLDLKLDLSYNGQDATFVMTGKYDMKSQKMGQIETLITATEAEDVQTAKTYILVNPTHVTSYTYIESSGKWRKEVLQGTLVAGSSSYVKPSAGKKLIGTETLESGLECDVYTMDMKDMADIKALLASSGVDISDADPEKIVVKILVDITSYYVRRIYIDFTDAIDEIYTADGYMKVSIFRYTVDYSNFNMTSVNIPIDDIEDNLDTSPVE